MESESDSLIRCILGESSPINGEINEDYQYFQKQYETISNFLVLIICSNHISICMRSMMVHTNFALQSNTFTH